MKVLLNDQAEHFIKNLNADSRSYEGVAVRISINRIFCMV